MTTPDIEVGVFAVRSFAFRENPDRLTSISTVTNLSLAKRYSADWIDGTCTAICEVCGQDAVPSPDCTCGIYAAMTIDSLRAQYRWHASLIVAVIAPEGRTIIGPNGLRTKRARVVAYWVPWYGRRVIAVARKQFIDATGYTVLNDMLATHGMPAATPCRDENLVKIRSNKAGLKKMGLPA